MFSIPLFHIPGTPRFIVATDKCFSHDILSVLTITDKSIGYFQKQTSQTINPAHIANIVKG